MNELRNAWKNSYMIAGDKPYRVDNHLLVWNSHNKEADPPNTSFSVWASGVLNTCFSRDPDSIS